jgi:hypothetical protein
MYFLGSYRLQIEKPTHLGLAAFILLIFFAGLIGQIDFVRGGMLLILGTTATFIFGRLVDRMTAGEGVEIQSHWGGLGGGLGGWRISQSLVLLIVGVVLLGSALGVALYERAPPGAATEGSKDPGEGKDRNTAPANSPAKPAQG